MPVTATSSPLATPKEAIAHLTGQDPPPPTPQWGNGVLTLMQPLRQNGAPRLGVFADGERPPLTWGGGVGVSSFPPRSSIW